MNGTIKAVFDAGALPVLISRLSSTNQVILEKVLLALGDIAMESAHYRDLCIEAGIVDLVLDLIHPDLPLSVLHKIVRVIACLCHSKDPPISIELIKQVLPTLHRLIQREDSDVPIELVLTFLQIAEQGTEQVQMIIDSGTVPRIVSLLES
ncbi:IBB domain-containing protein [Aphelenchoides bicaudatus]|nr:IBB domain-containing protein [Aphelenchoides bicaudatus]